MPKKPHKEITLVDDLKEDNNLSGRYETTYTALLLAYRIMSSKSGYTAQQLAEQLGVNAKTVRRHLTKMKEVFPIVEGHSEEHGKSVVYMSKDCYNIELIEDETQQEEARAKLGKNTDSNIFGFFEYLGVAMIHDALQGYKDSTLYSPFQMAIAKLLKELPDETRENFRRMRRTFVNKDKALESYKHKEEIINQLVEAVESQKTLELEYNSVNSKKISTKSIEPYALLTKEGSLYLSARDLGADGNVKTFKIDRVISVKETGKNFTKDLKLADELNCAKRIGVFTGDLTRVVAIFDEKFETLLNEKSFVPDQKTLKLKDGRVQVMWMVRGTMDIKRTLRQFVGEVEVVEPQSLRDEFISDIQKMAEVYKVADAISSVSGNPSNAVSVADRRTTKTITKPGHSDGKSKSI